MAVYRIGVVAVVGLVLVLGDEVGGLFAGRTISSEGTGVHVVGLARLLGMGWVGIPLG